MITLRCGNLATPIIVVAQLASVCVWVASTGLSIFGYLSLPGFIEQVLWCLTNTLWSAVIVRSVIFRWQIRNYTY